MILHRLTLKLDSENGQSGPRTDAPKLKKRHDTSSLRISRELDSELPTIRESVRPIPIQSLASSAANLMGLAMVRESRIPANDWGIRNAGVGVVYASDQVNMAVPKAAALLGIGRENLHYVPCDDS